MKNEKASITLFSVFRIRGPIFYFCTGTPNYAATSSAEVINQPILNGSTCGLQASQDHANRISLFEHVMVAQSLSRCQEIWIWDDCQLPNSVIVKKSAYSLTFNFFIRTMRGLFSVFFKVLSMFKFCVFYEYFIKSNFWFKSYSTV